MNELSDTPLCRTSLRVSVVHRRVLCVLLVAAAMVLLLFLSAAEMQTLTAPMPSSQESDLGDAPDTVGNHYNDAFNTAYSFTVAISGQFPTVWEGPVPSGPRHEHSISRVWLGYKATYEEEADLGYDRDGINNILPKGADRANLDYFDDGWLNPRVPLGNCRRAMLKVLVTKADPTLTQTLYLNVWFDGNRDGDWQDTGRCTQDPTHVQHSYEWIVQNHPIDPGAIPNGGGRVFYVPTREVLNRNPALFSWVRFTLSEQRAPIGLGMNLADGRGPNYPDSFVMGETEDYYVRGFDVPDPSWIGLKKRILRDDGELTDKETDLVPGREIAYELTVTSTVDMTRTVHISDDLPLGLVAVSAHASSGVVEIVNAGRTVIWEGAPGPANRPVRIGIRARLARKAHCDERFGNKALWWTPFAKGESSTVWFVVRCHELGDAPDSTNHYGVTMTAYSGVQAAFPTVYGGAVPAGPRHHRARPLHLGRLVSAEYEADIGPDMDGRNNIIPLKDVANLDKADDGLELDKMGFEHCKYHRFPVWVYVDPAAVALLSHVDRPAYLNVWLDGNHNGTWADLNECRPKQDPIKVPEHIVIDHPVNVSLPGLRLIWVTTSGLVYWPHDVGPAWLRVTLSEDKSEKLFGKPYSDGRGPAGGFALGETEDYFLRPPGERQPDVAVDKRVSLHPKYAHLSSDNRGPVWSVGWAIKYGNVGTAPAHGVRIVDTYDTGGIPLLSEPPAVHAVPPLPVVHGGQTFTFGVGTLLPGVGGHIAIRAKLPITAPPGAALTNTVTISTPGDVDLGNNWAMVTATIPLLPPKILHPRPGTTCRNTFTVTGQVQPLSTSATTPISVELYVDGSLYDTVAANLNGRWQVPVTLSDGDHELWAVARYQTMTSPESRHVKVTVDSSLPWSPISLHFTAQTGHFLWPRGPDGRMDETGWRVALRPGQTYTASVYSCCGTVPTITLEAGSPPPLTLQDLNGDGWYEGSFTAPAPLSDTLRLCVTCGLVQRCSDGQVLIDPEGTVYGLDTGDKIPGATVTCLEQQSDGSGGTTYTPWPADAFEQENPQTTGADGYYSFYTPAGTYRVGVTKDGYQAHLSDDLLIVDEPVHYDVYLAPNITETADFTVAITALGFDPPILSVLPGSVIAWVNVDGDYHATTSVTPTIPASGVAATAVGDPWDSGLLDTGEVYVHQLTEGGTYTYQDGQNAEFTGHILVEIPIYLPLVFRQWAGP